MIDLLIILSISLIIVFLFVIAWYHDKALIVLKIPETESELRCKSIKDRYEWLNKKWLKENKGEEND